MEGKEVANTAKTSNYTFHVTVINFDKEKHQDIYNEQLAKLLIKNQKEKAG